MRERSLLVKPVQGMLPNTTHKLAACDSDRPSNDGGKNTVNVLVININIPLDFLAAYQLISSKADYLNQFLIT